VAFWASDPDPKRVIKWWYGTKCYVYGSATLTVRTKIKKIYPRERRWQIFDHPFLQFTTILSVTISVADPDPNPYPPDPHVLGPPGSGSRSIRQSYGSGSFYHSAKMKNNKKNLVFYCFVTSFWFFIFKKWCKCSNVVAKSKLKKNFFKLVFCWRLEGQWWK
jgi:hypothetical protein